MPMCSPGQHLLQRARDLARQVDDALMPRRCAFCAVRSRAGEGGICHGCRDDLPWLLYACESCARPLSTPLPAGVHCAACQVSPLPVEKTIAPLLWAFPVDAGLKALKFRRQLYYGTALGEILVEAAERLPADVDALLPVPLHWRRMMLRGFNQATELCRPLRRALSLPVLRGVVRRRATAYQSGLTSRQREQNLRDAFVVKRPPASRHVLIVDDVITTGATTRHLALALQKSGVEQISVLAVARAATVRTPQPG
jgi:ComF family protein